MARTKQSCRRHPPTPHPHHSTPRASSWHPILHEMMTMTQQQQHSLESLLMLCEQLTCQQKHHTHMFPIITPPPLSNHHVPPHDIMMTQLCVLLQEWVDVESLFRMMLVCRAWFHHVMHRYAWHERILQKHYGLTMHVQGAHRLSLLIHRQVEGMRVSLEHAMSEQVQKLLGAYVHRVQQEASPGECALDSLVEVKWCVRLPRMMERIMAHQTALVTHCEYECYQRVMPLLMQRLGLSKQSVHTEEKWVRLALHWILATHPIVDKEAHPARDLARKHVRMAFPSSRLIRNGFYEEMIRKNGNSLHAMSAKSPYFKKGLSVLVKNYELVRERILWFATRAPNTSVDVNHGIEECVGFLVDPLKLLQQALPVHELKRIYQAQKAVKIVIPLDLSNVPIVCSGYSAQEPEGVPFLTSPNYDLFVMGTAFQRDIRQNIVARNHALNHALVSKLIEAVDMDETSMAVADNLIDACLTRKTLWSWLVHTGQTSREALTSLPPAMKRSLFCFIHEQQRDQYSLENTFVSYANERDAFLRLGNSMSMKLEPTAVASPYEKTTKTMHARRLFSEMADEHPVDAAKDTPKKKIRFVRV